MNTDNMTSDETIPRATDRGESDGPTKGETAAYERALSPGLGSVSEVLPLISKQILDPDRSKLIGQVLALRVGCFRIALSTDSCAAILCDIGDCAYRSMVVAELLWRRMSCVARTSDFCPVMSKLLSECRRL